MKLAPRTKFLLLMGFFIAPVVAAYISYFGWRPAGHTNYGDLIPPTPLQHTQGATADGQPLDLETLRGQWLMVHVGPAACDATCTQLLYYMRQTRIAQGKEQSRIDRVWVVEDGGVPAAKALEGQDALVVWKPASPDFVRQFALPAQATTTQAATTQPTTTQPTTTHNAHIYLVDPLGNLMLRFPADPDPKKIMKDLKLLLKASQIG
jgi:cytochrome oxidase Cu insertion factor (SCO1/SenC/PrrC family)